MRLIDADALKEQIEFHPTSVSVCMTVAEAKGQTYFKNRCLEDIDNAPTIEAEPVRCGKWIKGTRYKCSECGTEWDLDGTPKEYGMNYCAYCGARMEEEG